MDNIVPLGPGFIGAALGFIWEYNALKKDNLIWLGFLSHFGSGVAMVLLGVFALKAGVFSMSVFLGLDPYWIMMFFILVLSPIGKRVMVFSYSRLLDKINGRGVSSAESKKGIEKSKPPEPKE